MADFFKGLAGGMQTGLQFGRAVRKRRMEDDLAQAYAKPETSQGYTAAQGQELEAIAAAKDNEGRPFYNVQVDSSGNYSVIPNFPTGQSSQVGLTGLADGLQDNADIAGQLQARANLRAAQAAPQAAPQPIPFSQQQVQDYGGRRVAGQFDPTELRGLQMQEAARVLGSYGDVRGAAALEAQADELRRNLARDKRADELFPLQKEALEQGIKKSGFELTAAERAAADAKRTDDFNEWRSQNPQADFATMTAKAQELGMSVDQQFKIASNLTGIKEQAFKAAQQRIQELVQDQGLDGLLKAHKESKDLDPNSHFEVIRGQGGKLSLNRVNTATGEVIQPNVFSGSEAETTAYLNKAAMNPATIIDFTMNLEKIKSGLGKDAAAIRASDATVRYRDKQGKALDAAKGLTQKQEDFQRALDGVFEGYQSAMALGPQGRQAAAIYAREYDQLRANTPKGLRAPPSIASMNEAQRAEKPEKPVKVEDAGVQYKVGGKLMQTDGRGGLISAKGILPDDRPTVLKTVGISDNNASRLMWSDDGETVMFNNEEFDIRDKRDVEKLNRMLKDYDVMNRTIAEEARLRANPTSPSGFQGARTTGIGPASTYGVAPGAQSIYGR